MSGEFSRGSAEDVEILGGTNQLPNLFSFTFVAIQNSRAAEGDWVKIDLKFRQFLSCFGGYSKLSKPIDMVIWGGPLIILDTPRQIISVT